MSRIFCEERRLDFVSLCLIDVREGLSEKDPRLSIFPFGSHYFPYVLDTASSYLASSFQRKALPLKMKAHFVFPPCLSVDPKFLHQPILGDISRNGIFSLPKLLFHL